MVNTIIEIDWLNYTENVVITENNKYDVAIKMIDHDWKYIVEGEIKAVEVVYTEDNRAMYRCGDKVKFVLFDTFGEDYRNKWIQLRESSLGVYFVSSYLNNKRVYLAYCNTLAE